MSEPLCPFTYRYEPGPWSQWAAMSNVDNYVAVGESLGDALALAVEASQIGFTEAQPSPTDLMLARATS